LLYRFFSVLCDGCLYSPEKKRRSPHIGYTDRRPLRSAVARTHNSFGDRSFSAAGQRVWNSLPPHLRQDMNFARFQRKLKTFLFGS